jgi:hypothetical protein
LGVAGIHSGSTHFAQDRCACDLLAIDGSHAISEWIREVNAGAASFTPP